jgi:dUTPase
LIIAPVMQAMVCEVADLDETTRGVAGFGSTGTGQEKGGDGNGPP